MAECSDYEMYQMYDEALKSTSVSEYINNPVYKKRIYKAYKDDVYDTINEEIQELINGIIGKYNLDEHGIISERMLEIMPILLHHISTDAIYSKDFIHHHPECIDELLQSKVARKQELQKEKELLQKEEIEYQKKQYNLLYAKK